MTKRNQYNPLLKGILQLELKTLLFLLQCLIEPLKPQYRGGILRNPEFNKSLKGWSTYGHAKTATRISATGNRFAVAKSRKQPHQSVSQKIQLRKGMLYSFSGLSWSSHLQLLKFRALPSMLLIKNINY